MKYIDWFKMRDVARAQIGKEYKFGHEVKLDDPNPVAFDCSELVQYLYAHIGIIVPDGSQNQFDASVPVSSVQFGDVGFFKRAGAERVHHVGLIYDDVSVLEARGTPFNKVTLRPITNWEAWKDFTGWRRFKCVME